MKIIVPFFLQTASGNNNFPHSKCEIGGNLFFLVSIAHWHNFFSCQNTWHSKKSGIISVSAVFYEKICTWIRAAGMLKILVGTSLCGGHNLPPSQDWNVFDKNWWGPVPHVPILSDALEELFAQWHSNKN